MPKKKSPAANQPAADTLSFEDALAELQTIVEKLEDGQLGLQDSLLQYEQGTGLLRHCDHILSTAEQKIEQLTGFDAAGNPVTEPFDNSATHHQGTPAAGRRAQKKTSKKTAAPKPEAGSLFETDD